MSISAIAWVLKQDIRPSAVKFVLLALADNAGGGDERDNAVVWPSIPTICQKTSQNRKTVISALDILERMQLLADTGERCGATRQVKVYRIIGLPQSVYHYTYRLENPDGEFYIGVRSCDCKPEIDSNYRGSGRWPKSAKSLTKTIISTYATRTEAEAAEIRLIRENAGNEKMQNIARNYGRVPQAALLLLSAETVPFTDDNSSVNGTSNRKRTVIPKEAKASYASPNEFTDLWNDCAPTPCAILTGRRLVAYRARMAESYSRENWEQAITKMQASDFLQGKNARGWKATVDWFLRPGSIAKIMEGKYDNRKKTNTKERTTYTAADFERDGATANPEDAGASNGERTEGSC